LPAFWLEKRTPLSGCLLPARVAKQQGTVRASSTHSQLLPAEVGPTQSGSRTSQVESITSSKQRTAFESQDGPAHTVNMAARKPVYVFSSLRKPPRSPIEPAGGNEHGLC
jgi:hypothetical protein